MNSCISPGTNAIVLFDFATGWLDCIPVKSRNTDEAVRAINIFRGPEARIKQLYADKAPEFGLACSKLGLVAQRRRLVCPELTE